MRFARAEDGEAFAILTSNPFLPTSVKLNVRLVEADQVTTPVLNPLQSGAGDGIVFDDDEIPANTTFCGSMPATGVWLVRYSIATDFPRTT